MLNTFGLGLFNSCIDCICGSCATSYQRCTDDADCGPILQCRSGCEGGQGPACEE